MCMIYKIMVFCSYATSVFPIGAMFAMTLWLGNTAYLYISVAFAQMLKAVSKRSVFCSLGLGVYSLFSMGKTLK